MKKNLPHAKQPEMDQMICTTSPDFFSWKKILYKTGIFAIALLIANLFLMGNTFAQTTTTFTTAGATTWLCPAGVTVVTVECWGGGGAGGSATGNAAAGGGGAGGAYTKAVRSVVPGTTYSLTVGAGGTGGSGAGPAGGSSFFINNTTLLAVGGPGGAAATVGTTGAGGTAPTSGNLSVGHLGSITNFYGGNGSNSTSTGRGGSGGASAGSGGDGGDATTTTAGVAPTGGGVGGLGSTSNANGVSGTAPGGGGAGGKSTTTTVRNGGSGATGKVAISYGNYRVSFGSDLNTGAATWCAGETRNVTISVTNAGLQTWTSNGATGVNFSYWWSSQSGRDANNRQLPFAGLAAGQTQLLTIPVVAPAAGTVTLNFDLVKEAACWFGDNTTSCSGPGNIVFTSGSITVNALPTTTISYSSSSFCTTAGTASPTISGTTGGPLTGTSFGAGAGLAINTASGVITPASSTAGTYTITYSFTGANGCGNTATTSVTIAAPPTTAVAGSATPSTICSNGSSVLAANTPGIGTGAWSVVAGSPSTLTSQFTGGATPLSNPSATFTPAGGAGTYTLRWTISNSPCTASTSDVVVTVQAVIGNNTVSGAQTICTGTTPPSGLTGTIPSGGNGTYTYLWESSITSATAGFSAAAGTNNGQNYTVPGTLTQTTWYRRTVTSGPCADNISTAIQITVTNVIGNNTVSAANPAICTGTAPALTGTAPNGGTGTYVYLWESSTTDAVSGFATAAGTSNGQNYTAPAGITQTAWYRRTVTSGNCSGNVSAAQQITVSPVLAGNTIGTSQTICTGTTPAGGLTGSVPTGGNGTYTYLWQSSTTSASAGFGTATGTSNGQNYTPPNLTQTTWYQRQVTSGGCTNTSAVIQITVNSNISANTIAAAQSICMNTAPAALTGSTPAGGNGSYTYLWESSTTSASVGFSDAPGTNNGQNYIPPVLTQTTWYRRTVTSAPCASNVSTAIQITVNPVLANNTIAAAQAICSAQTPASLTGSLPTGGSGTYVYLWESSTTSASSGFGTATGTSNGQNYSPAALTQTTWFRRTVTSGGCTDIATPIQITVYPKATITAMTVTVCGSALFTATPLNGTNGTVPAGTTYSWSAPSVTGSMTGGTSGSGASSISGTLVNQTGAVQTAIYTVTPLTVTAPSGSCTGANFTVTVTVNPTPVAAGTTICQNGSGSISSSTACLSGSPITSAYTFPTNGTNINSGGTAWTNPGNVVSDNNVNVTYAVVSSGFSTVTGSSQTLSATQYGFAIPANATILGIQMTIGRYETGTSGLISVQDNLVQLLKAGAVIGSNLGLTSTDWPASEMPQSYGSSTNLWGTTWTPAEINATNFGAALKVDNSAFLATATANVDYIQIAITYSVPGSLNWYTVSSNGAVIGSGSPFNPVGVLNSGLGTTSNAGTTTFYVECSTIPGCRTPADFVINANPTITLGTNPSVTRGASSANLPYSATTQSPSQYSVTWTGSPSGFGAVTNAALPASPIGLTISATANVNSYSGNLTVKNTATGCVSGNNAFSVTITPVALTGSFTASDKTYDGNTTATVTGRSLSGVLAGDVSNVTLSGGTATFNNANAGAGKTVTLTGATLSGSAAGNYTLASVGTTTATINALGITGSFTALNKTYDGNISATAATHSLSGVLAGDIGNVSLTGGTATFANASTGTGKTVTLTGATLTGSVSGNYNLTSVSTTTAAINALGITGSFTASDKSYDGNTSATVNSRSLSGVLAGDIGNVSLSGGTATFADANSGTGKTVTLTGATLAGSASGNYSLSSVGTTTADINGIGITGSFTAADKTYDGNASTTVATRSLSGVLAGDIGNVSLLGGTATFDDANAGAGKTVTLTNATLAGSAAGNYSLTSVSTTAADINALGITGLFTSSDKIYDGDNSATAANRSLSGVLAGDVGDVILTGGIATFADANAGTNKTVTLTGATLIGSAAGNYSLSSVATATDNITALAIIITPDAGQHKVFGTADPSFTYSFSPALISPDVFSNVLGRANGEAPGEYAFTLGTLSAGNNYSLSLNGINTFSISSLSEGVADFRSQADGNFTSAAVWEYNLGGNNWTNATQAPGIGNNVSITHNVTLNQNFEIGAAKTLLLGTGGTLTVDPKWTLTPTGIADFGGKLVTFRSTADGFGSLGVVASPAGTHLQNASNVTVERFIPNSSGYRTWRLLSIPTFGSQTIKEAWQEGNVPLGNNKPGFGTQIPGPGGTGAGFDATASGNAASLLSWNGTGWSAVASTLGEISADPYRAYFLFVRGDRTKGMQGTNSNTSATTLETHGAIYSGDQTIPVTDGDNKFSLVPNLYPSAIKFSTLTKNNVDDTYYIWDSKITSNGTLTGKYQTFSGPNHYASVGGGSYPMPNVTNDTIESGQAFLVHTTATGPHSVVLHESDKINVTNGNLGLRPATPAALVKIDTRLYTVSGSNREMADGNAVVFDNIYSGEVDRNDAVKLNNPGENLAILTATKSLAVEARPYVSESDVISFKMWNLHQQAYQLEFVPSNLGTSGVTAQLEDAYLRTSTPVSLDALTVVNFTVDANAASSASDRFRIVFRPTAPLPVTFISISAGRTNAGVQVDWKVAAETNIRSYEIERSTDGSNFIAAGIVSANGNTATGSSYRFTDAAAPATVVFYRVKSIGTGGELKYTTAVKVIAGKVKPGFVISPNPVKGGVINLQFSNQPEGRYTVTLLSNAGQAIFTSIVTHTGGNSTQILNLPAAIARGTYQVEIIGPDKNKTTKPLLIQNK